MSRSRHKPASHEHYDRCRLCNEEFKYNVVPRIEAVGHTVCLACALKLHEALAAHYNMPEITAVERVAHYKKTGPEGWRQAPAHANEPGWVYYIRMGDVIKIGYAQDVTKRMRAYPPSAELLAVHPGTKEVERQMHLRFAGNLAHGREWFTETQELTDHIASVVDQFGDPSKMSYEYTRPKTQEEKVAAMFKTRHHLEIARGVHSAV